MHPIYDSLYEDQKSVVNAIGKYIKLPFIQESPFKLSAKAGMGKSFLMSSLPHIFPDFTWVFLAPTDTAVQVLRKMLDKQGLQSVDALTAHSFFALGLDYFDDGDSFNFMSEFEARPLNVSNTIVVIDECSMSPVIFNQAAEARGLRAIYVGDPHQLPPVKGQAVFDVLLPKKQFDCQLHIPKRSENPEVQAAVDAIAVRGFKAVRQESYISVKKVARQIADWSIEGLDTRFLSYRHSIVNQMADDIRYEISGRWAHEPYIKGEKIRLASVIINSDKVVKNNSTMVVDLQEEMSIHGFVDGVYHSLPLINKLKYDKLYADAKQKQDRKLWRKFYNYKHSCARISSVYSSTVHSSQGQTLDRIIFDLEDMKRFGCPKILYTAATRSRGFYMYC